MTPTSAKSSSPGSTRALLAGAALYALALALRAWGADGQPDDWDGADFVLALDEFDLERWQPHFPGYPVYVGAAWLLHQTGVGAAAALESVGAALGALAPVALVAILRRGSAGRGPWPWLAGCLAATQPALVWQGGRIGTDAAGLGLAAAALALLLHGRRGLGGFVLGVAMGVRPSYFPFLALVFLPGRTESAGIRPLESSLRNSLAGLALGLGAWLLPFVFLHGDALARSGVEFIGGHFQDWGGTVLSTSSPAVLDRLRLWALQLVGVVAGMQEGPWPVAALWGATLLAIAGACAAGAHRVRSIRSSMRFWCASGAYPAWILLAQNPTSARHLLPMALAAAALPLAPRSPRLRWAVFIVLASAWAPLAVCIQAAQRAHAPPAATLAAALSASSIRTDDRLFAGASWRLLELHGLGRRLHLDRARSFADALEEVNAQLHAPENVFVTSELSGIPGTSRPVASLRRPAIPWDERLELHRFRVCTGDRGLATLATPEPRAEQGLRRLTPDLVVFG